MRLAVARLRFCSNSFSPRRTRVEDMQAHEWQAGAAVLSRVARDGGELDGLQQFLQQRPGWDVTMLRCASAPPGGPLASEFIGAWLAEVEDALRRGRFDAVYLSLHGACQAEGDPATDLTILRRVRSIVGHTPVVASFDRRANLAEEVAILLDGASVDRGGERPRFDAATRALSMLEGILAGTSRPVGALTRVPMLMSDLLLDEVLSEIWRDRLEVLPHPVIDASVCGGFSWGDSLCAGPSAMAWADRDAGAARSLAAHLSLSLSRRRVPATAPPVTPDIALGLVARMERTTLPLLLLDCSDDPASGGPSDTPELLRALLSAPPAGRTLLAALHDPETVAAAVVIGVEATLDRSLGGRTTALYGAPVRVQAVVKTVVKQGARPGFALLRVRNVDILVTATRPPAITLSWLAGFGLDLSAYQVLALKGGGVTRAACAAATSDIVDCDCPGPTDPDLLRLPFHFVPALRRAPATGQIESVESEPMPERRQHDRRGTGQNGGQDRRNHPLSARSH